MFNMSMTKLVSLGTGLFAFFVVLVTSPQLVENVDAKDIVVIQSAISGDLAVYTEPGWRWQGFGKVTTYPRRDQFSFLIGKVDSDGKTHLDESINTRFNDGGSGKLSGTLYWAMPITNEKIVKLHTDFGSIAAV